MLPPLINCGLLNCSSGARLKAMVVPLFCAATIGETLGSWSAQRIRHHFRLCRRCYTDVGVHGLPDGAIGCMLTKSAWDGIMQPVRIPLVIIEMDTALFNRHQCKLVTPVRQTGSSTL